MLIDLNPEVYNINYPQESRIPLGSLDMQRQSDFFQQSQSYLHRRAMREASFGRNGYQMGIVAQWQKEGYKNKNK